MITKQNRNHFSFGIRVLRGVDLPKKNDAKTSRATASPSPLPTPKKILLKKWSTGEFLIKFIVQ
jgi:hypothetical protein